MPHDPQFCRKWYLVLLRNVHFGSKYFKLRTSFPIFFSFSRKACLRSLKTDVVLRPIASLKALLAANTIKKSRKFCVTRNHSDSFESVFQRSGTLLNGSGYPFEKKLLSIRTAMANRLKKKCHPYDSGYPFEKIVIRWNSSGYPFKK